MHFQTHQVLQRSAKLVIVGSFGAEFVVSCMPLLLIEKLQI